MITSLLFLSLISFAEASQRLYVDHGQASSYLRSNWNKYDENYHPNYAFDDDPKTAWVEGADGHGESEELSFKTSLLQSANEVELKIWNGYQKSNSLMKANSSPKDVLAVIMGKSQTPVFEQKISLKQQMGPQSFKFTLEERKGFSGISLKVLSVYPGTKYKDAAISDVQVFVKSKVPYDKFVEEQKMKGLVQWKKDRLKDAAYFANLPDSYPFAATTFRASSRSESGYRDCTSSPPCKAGGLERWYKNPELVPRSVPKEIISEMAHLQKVIRELVKSSKHYRLVPSEAANARVQPDLPSEFRRYTKELSWMAFVRSEELSLFEAMNAQEKLSVRSHPDSNVELYDFVSNAKIQFQTGNKPKYIYRWRMEHGLERGIYTVFESQLLAYDSSGRLESILYWYPTGENYSLATANANKIMNTKISVEPEFRAEYIRMRYDAKNKVNQVDYTNLSTADLQNEYDTGEEASHIVSKPVTTVIGSKE